MDELLAVKDRAWARFCSLPGVHAVGIGGKVTGGRRSDELAIAVFVQKKLPREQVAPDELIPPSIEGVTTDVVEMRPPRLLQSTAPTANEQAIQGGKRFTFKGPGPGPDPDPYCPPIGSMLVVTTTVTSQTATGSKVFVGHAPTNGRTPMANLVHEIAERLPAPVKAVSFQGPPAGLTVTAEAGHTIAATAHVLPMDFETYTKDYLRGGIRIRAGQVNDQGTLGCLATLSPTPDHPAGRVVGLTCAHVLRYPTSLGSTLLLEPEEGSNNAMVIGALPSQMGNPASPPRPIETHNVAFVAVLRGAHQLLGSASYATRPAETPVSVAASFVQAINAAGIPGVSAAVTLTTWNGRLARIQVDGLGPTDYVVCHAKGPPKPQIPLLLQATVNRLAVTTNTVVLSGEAPNGRYGVFVDINRAGGAASFGVFHNPPRKQPLEQMAKSLADAINQVDSALRGPVTASEVGASVLISNAEQVEVWVQNDVRVGHPIDYFGSPYPACCNFRIGRILDARTDLDAALVQIDAGLKYKRHVEGLNLVQGTQAPTVDLAVQARGTTSGKVEGVVTYVGTSGYVIADRFSRVYRNAAIVVSTVKDVGGQTLRAFALPGDSGAAVVTKGATPHKLVGIVFGGPDDATALVTPIDDITNAFSGMGLAFQGAAAADPNAVETVPPPADAFRALDPDEHLATTASGLFGSSIAASVRRLEQDMHTSASGREYTELVRRHFGEAFELVNRNRRVATVWHRSGGPQLLNAILRVIRFDDEPLPLGIEGRPLAECLLRLREGFARYASPPLSRAFARLTMQLTELAGMTYPQALATLRTASGNGDAR